MFPQTPDLEIDKIVMPDPDLRLFLIAALHFELATGAHRLKLVPKRLVDFLELRVLFGSAVARQMARTAVVRRVGRAGQVPPCCLSSFFLIA